MLKRSLMFCFIALCLFTLSFTAYTSDDTDNTRYFELYVNAYARAGIPADISAFPDEFRIFIPPGTVYVGISLKMARDEKFGIVARYKRPPDAKYSSYAWHEEHYSDIPWDWETGVTLDLLQQRDVYLKNPGGTIQIPHSLTFSSPLTPEEAGWLYIKKIPFDSDWIMEMHAIIRVEKQAYLKWYNGVIPYTSTAGCVDSNEGYTGATYCWDANHDPWTEASSYVSIYQLIHSSFYQLYSPDNSTFWGTDSVPVTYSGSTTLVTYSGSTTCTISVFSSADPTQYTYHTIELVVPKDNKPIPDDNVVTFKYDGTTYTIICDGTVQNLGRSSYPELQNKISCTVAENRTGVSVNLTLFDQDSYSNTYSECPGYTIDATLKNTNKKPYCLSDNTIAQTSACKWERQNVNDSLLNERGVPLNNWVVYGKTTVKNLSLGYNVLSGSTSFAPTDYVCVQDANGNGIIDEGEIETCIKDDSGNYFCPLGAVECVATYSDPICPAGGSLNTDTDKCEATPDISCPSGYTYNSDFDVCVANAICSNGGSLNPNTDKCEIVISSSQCPSGYTYDVDLNACIKDVDCPAGGTYNPARDKCEIAATLTCPTGYTYNSSINKCETNPVCPAGSSYKTSVDKCTRTATLGCPSGYTYNSSTGKCERNPQCPSGSSYNPSTNRCEVFASVSTSCPLGNYPCINGTCTKTGVCSSTQVPYTGYLCPVTGQVYQDQTTCNNNCVKVGSCSLSTNYVNLSGLISKLPCGDTSVEGSGNVLKAVYHKWSLPEELGRIVFPSQCRLSGSYWNDSRTKLISVDAHHIYTNMGTITIEGCKLVNIRTWRLNDFFCLAEFSVKNSHHIIASSVWCDDEFGCYNEAGFSADVVIEAYRCSLNNQTYSDLTTCQNNCRQGVTCVTHTDYTTKWVCSLNNQQYDTQSQCTSSCYQTAFCSTQYNCPSGYINVGGLCIANPTCPYGGTLNTSRDKCEITPIFNCPSGFTYDSTIKMCVENATCPDGGSLNTVRDKCELSVTESCPTGYTYNNPPGLCQSNPVCNYGFFDSSIDKCRLSAATLCPADYTFSASQDKCLKDPAGVYLILCLNELKRGNPRSS